MGLVHCCYKADTFNFSQICTDLYRSEDFFFFFHLLANASYSVDWA